MRECLAFAVGCLLTALPLLIFAGGLYFSVRLRFVFFLHPVRCLRTLRKGSRTEKEGVSPLRAVTLALAGTLGVGNIAGVGLALLFGGAGAVFWMWISALVAMALKYAEVLLARVYAQKTGDGRGGAMRYIRDGLGGRIGRIFGGLFAALCLLAALTLGGAVQANAIGEAVTEGLGVPPILVGGVLVLLAAVPIFCGRRAVDGLIQRLLPAVSVLYIAVTVAVIACHIDRLPSVLLSILRDAFSFRSTAGGVVGFLTAKQLRLGATRGLLSNEAGCGTSPMAHAESHASPTAEGLYGVLEVFIDTVFICSLTALAILSAFPDGLPTVSGGVALTLAAVKTVFPHTGGAVLMLCITVFAYATVLCWAYYSENCILWFTKSRISLLFFRAALVASLPVGVLLSSGAVFLVTDAILALLCFVNCSCVLLLSETVLAESRKAGLLSPQRARPSLRVSPPKGGEERRE